MRETITEAFVDFGVRASTSSKQSDSWVTEVKGDGILGKVILRPRDAYLNFNNYTELVVGQGASQHFEDVFRPEISPTGRYSVDSQGNLVGNFSVSVDFSTAGHWLGVQTAVLYLVFGFEGTSGITPSPDWKITVDIASIFQYSNLVFSKTIGAVSGIPAAWVYKFIGYLLPNPGKMEIGLKVFGTAYQDRALFFTETTATLMTLRGSGELVGRPVVGEPQFIPRLRSDSDSDWELV